MVTFINHWISTLNISCLYPEWHIFKWYCQFQFGINVLFCKNKLLSNLTEIEQFPWRKLFWVAFGSDLVSENKFSSKVFIQSPQTEKVKGNWLEKKKFGVALYCPLQEKKKELLKRCAIPWLIVNEPVVVIFLKRNCSCTAHKQKRPFWLLLFVTSALSVFPQSAVLAVSHPQAPRPNLPPFSHQDPNYTQILT